MLFIAGIQFNIRTDTIILPKAENLAKPYCQFFLNHTTQIATHNIDIFITAEPIPDMALFEKTFEGGDAWNIYSYAGECYIANEIPAFPDPLWVARVHQQEDKVTIYCSSRMMKMPGKELMMHPMSYPLDQILMTRFLADYQGAIFHAAGWIDGNGGWVFPGRSGAGKTTIARLFANASGIKPVSDDRVAVRRIGNEFRFYGTPWPGEAGYAENQSAELSGIFFLEQGGQNLIDKLSPSEAVSRLFPIMSVPWYDAKRVDRIMAFCDDLLKTIPAYVFKFRPDDTAVKFLQGFINERQD